LSDEKVMWLLRVSTMMTLEGIIVAIAWLFFGTLGILGVGVVMGSITPLMRAPVLAVFLTTLLGISLVAAFVADGSLLEFLIAALITLSTLLFSMFRASNRL